MVECAIPSGVHEPSGLERAYINAAQGRFYRTRWDAVLLERTTLTGGGWTYTFVPRGTEVATATASGLPTMTMPAYPATFADGSPIARVPFEDRARGGYHGLGAAELRWVPSVAIVSGRSGDRLAHGWMPIIDLDAIAASGIAGNALRYDIAIQRCMQAEAARERETERREMLAAGGSLINPTVLVSTVRDADAGAAVHDLDIVRALREREAAKGETAEQGTPSIAGSMGVAIVGTIAVVGLLGLVVWAAGGSR